jgi:hypothetical protein
MLSTKVFVEKFKGYDTMSVWAIDEAGNKVGNYPLFSVGTRKAAALARHLEEVKQFAAKGEASLVKELEKMEEDDESGFGSAE